MKTKVVNFDILKTMIHENAPPVHVHNPKKIKRKHGCIVVTTGIEGVQSCL
jgi:hypothetical protein